MNGKEFCEPGEFFDSERIKLGNTFEFISQPEKRNQLVQRGAASIEVVSICTDVSVSKTTRNVVENALKSVHVCEPEGLRQSLLNLHQAWPVAYLIAFGECFV